MRVNKTNPSKLTKRELEIMTILWESQQPLIASDIAKHGDNMTINTAQALIKKLLQRDYVKVADIVYSGTVLSRSYTTAISRDDYEMQNILASYQNISDKQKGMSRFVSAFLEEETNPELLLSEIDELQALLHAKKEELNNKISQR